MRKLAKMNKMPSAIYITMSNHEGTVEGHIYETSEK